MTNALGIDIGGSGVKGGVVDLHTGRLVAPRVRIPTPSKSTPKNVAKVVAQIVQACRPLLDDGPIGMTIPAPVVGGAIPFMANLDQAWVDCAVEEFFRKALGREVTVLNDADAAGIAEARYGAARGRAGVVILTTLGTGIGTAILNNGVLLPNTELGHLEISGEAAEARASAAYKENSKLSYKAWAVQLNVFYQTLERLFWPELFVVGGGVSRDHEKYLPLLSLRTPIIPAELRNEAGIVGAAWAAAERAGRTGAPAGPGSGAEWVTFDPGL